jgi:hypothetical protein
MQAVTLTKDRPAISSERTPHKKKQDRNCQTVLNIWSTLTLTWVKYGRKSLGTTTEKNCAGKGQRQIQKTELSSRQRGRPTEWRKNIWLDTKIYWLTGRQSQCDFDFEISPRVSPLKSLKLHCSKMGFSESESESCYVRRSVSQSLLV